MGTLREILRAYRYTSSKHWEQFNELERLAKIGKAAEKAFDYFSMGTVDENDKEYFVFLTVEDMLEWAEKED